MLIIKPKMFYSGGTKKQGAGDWIETCEVEEDATDASSINLSSGVKKGRDARAVFTENVRLKLRH